MDRADVLKIMAVLRGNYPLFYRNISREEAEDTVNLWCSRFQNEDYQIVSAAVAALIDSDTGKYPPNIGSVKEKIRLITGGDELTEAEAWGIVAKALRNSAYGSREEFEKFPPIIKRIVGNPAQLREWAQMDSETVHSVVASNFQRSYKAIASREREFTKLPPDVKALVGKLEGNKKMDALPEKKPELPPPEDNPVHVPREKLMAAINPRTGRSREEVLAMLKGGAAPPNWSLPASSRPRGYRRSRESRFLSERRRT